MQKLLAVAIASAMSTSAAVKIEKTSYQGWPNCYRVSNGEVELVITSDVGPRVIHLSVPGGENLFGVMPEQAGLTGGDEWRLYGGHRFWHSPEAKPRTYFPDNTPVEAVIDGDTLRLIPPVETTTGIQKEIDLTLIDGQPQVEVRHILEKVHSLGEDKLRSMVSCEQSGLKIAPHTGCHFLRPSGIGLPEDPIAPAMLADIASWSGAEVVNKEFWPECCGGGVSSVDEGLSSRMLERVAGIYRAKGANCILTPCPFCFSQFDLRQKGGLPVLYITELIAMAMAAPAERLGLRYHRVKVMQ